MSVRIVAKRPRGRTWAMIGSISIQLLTMPLASVVFVAISEQAVGAVITQSPTCTSTGYTNFSGVNSAGCRAIYSTANTSGDSGTFLVPAGVTSVDVLLVGGGGGGGYDAGGGGGGGVVVEKWGVSVSPGDSISVSVGGAGSAAPSSYTASACAGGGSLGSGGGNGYASTVVIGSTTVIARGGGGGGGRCALGGANGNAGGSGHLKASTVAGGFGTTVSGWTYNNGSAAGVGGAGTASAPLLGGGGGGAGGDARASGFGGVALASKILGRSGAYPHASENSSYVGGGGGGGCFAAGCTSGTGGTGAGSGGNITTNGGAGTDGTGSGGGGGGEGGNRTAGRGGTGLVVFQYAASTPSITSSAIATSIVAGSAYTTTLAATVTAGTPSTVTWAVASGALPTGLTLDASSGVISGTPTTEGHYAGTITASNVAGVASTAQAFSFTVFDCGSATATSCYATFSSVGTWTFTRPAGITNVDVLVVGGGGGGGFDAGGGGGGGQVKYQSAVSIDATESVVVGAGSAGGTSGSKNAVSASASTMGTAAATISASGGNGGKGCIYNGSNCGGVNTGGADIAGVGVTGSGAGGTGFCATSTGAGCSGASASQPGGAGYASSITRASVKYGPGGHACYSGSCAGVTIAAYGRGGNGGQALADGVVGSSGAVIVSYPRPVGTPSLAAGDLYAGYAVTVGGTVTATLTFGVAVTVAGTPTLALNIGGVSRNATYSSGSGTTALVFTYTVQSGDNDLDGISLDANALSMAGGSTLSTTYGLMSQYVTSALANTSTVTVDTTAPDAPSITSSATSTSLRPVITGTAPWQFGTAEAPAYVKVTVGSGNAVYTVFLDSTGSVSANASRAWTLDLAAETPGSGTLVLDPSGANSISAVAYDPVGNPSPAATQTLTINTSNASNCVESAPSLVNGKQQVTITATGTCRWVAPAGRKNYELVLAGGGGSGGSANRGGGGGGGAVLVNTSASITRGSTHTLHVGSGGSAVAAYAGSSATGSQISNAIPGNNGASTIFDTIVAPGGGGGGSGPRYAQEATTAGRSGGSGGGSNLWKQSGSAGASSITDFAGWSEYGNAGALGVYIAGNADSIPTGAGGGGGGGGAMGTGTSATAGADRATGTGVTAGQGGAGLSINGLCLGGGGGSVAYNNAANGSALTVTSTRTACKNSSGVTQAGEYSGGYASSLAGIDGTGGGGAGNNGLSGAGGSGVIVIRYTADTNAPTAPTVTSSSNTSDTTPAVSGTSEGAASVVVQLNRADGSTVATAPATSASGTEAGSGSWSYDFGTMVGFVALADGTYTVRVTATDIAGNVSTAGTQSLVVDTAAPAAPAFTSSNQFGTALPTITGTAEPSSAISLVINSRTYTTTADESTGVWSVNVTAEANLATGNSYTASVRATDAAGNQSGAGTQNVTVDTSSPAAVTIVRTSPVASVTSGTTASFTWSLPFGVTKNGDPFRCSIDGGAYSDCPTDGSTAATFTAVSEGTHSLSITYKNGAGTTSNVAVSTWTRDTTPPAVAAFTSATLTATSSPTLTGTAEVGAVVTVTVGGGTYVATRAIGAWTVVVDPAVSASLNLNGANTVSVVVTDGAGNASGSASQTLTIDTSAPVAAVISSSGLTNLPGPQISGTAEANATVNVVVGGATFTTSVDSGGAWSVDTSTDSHVGVFHLAAGANSVSVTVRDAAGNSSTTAIQSLEYDGIGPAISAVSISSSAGADGYYKSGDVVRATVTFAEAIVLSTTGGSPKIKLVIGSNERLMAYHSVTATAISFTYTVQSGDNTEDGVEVLANSFALNGATIRDAATNSASITQPGLGAQSSHKVDTAIPVAPVLASGPASPTASRSATLVLTVEDNAAIICSLNSVAFSGEGCGSTVSLSGLSEGIQTVVVRQTDAAGNTSASTTITWSIDLTAPSIAWNVTATRYSRTLSPRWTLSDGRSVVVIRQSTSLASDGDCGTTWSRDGLVADQGVQSNNVATAVLVGRCYRWTVDSAIEADALPPADVLGNVQSSGLTSGVYKSEPKPRRTPRLVDIPESATVGSTISLDVDVRSSETGSGSIVSVTRGVCTASGTSVVFVGVGECNISAFVEADGEWAAATGDRQSITVKKGTAGLAVLNTPSAAQAVGANWTPRFEFGSGIDEKSAGAVSVSAGPSGTCDAAEGTVAFRAIGDCNVEVSNAGGDNFDAATVSKKIAIGGKPTVGSIAIDSSQSAAEVVVSISPNNAVTSVEVEWSTTSTFAGSTSKSLDEATGVAAVTRQLRITGLAESRSYFLRVTVRNVFGSNVSSVQAFEAGGAVGVSINDGQLFTNDRRVELNVTAPLGAKAIVVSNDGGFKDQKSFPIQSVIPWILASTGNDRLPKTVYLRFTLADDSRSANYTDDIVLDQTAPNVTGLSGQSVTGSSTVVVQAIRPTSGGSVVQLRVRAKDDKSGVVSMQISRSSRGTKPSTLKFSSIVKVGLKTPVRVLFIRVQDGAGNWSKWTGTVIK